MGDRFSVNLSAEDMRIRQETVLHNLRYVIDSLTSRPASHGLLVPGFVGKVSALSGELQEAFYRSLEVVEGEAQQCQ